MDLVPSLLFCILTVCCVASAKVVLIGSNTTLSFDDIEANFAPAIKTSGEYGVLYLAEPLDACSDLTSKADSVSNGSSPFVLIIRGGCSFEDKVRKAQKAGFKATIIYDDEEDGVLIAMAGNSAGIKIHAVFVSKASGEILKKYVGSTDMDVWLLPSFENSAWSIMAISFISLLAMSAVLATCFFVRRHRIRRQRSQGSRVREFHGMSRRLVKAMPSLVFTSAVDDSCTSATCAICLEDYSVGEKLRVLPCRHKFHAFCVDSWLTAWRTFCPVCKRDARTSTGEPPASESTPLLSSNPSSIASSSILSSFRSSLPSSPAIQIAPGSAPSTSISFSTVHASSYFQPSFRSSHRQSPPISVSRSSIDLRRHGSSQRSCMSHLASPQSSVYPSISPLNSRFMAHYRQSPGNETSPLNSRFMAQYRQSPGNETPSLVSSSGHQFHPLRCSESAGTFSPYASNYSLPEC